MNDLSSFMATGAILERQPESRAIPHRPLMQSQRNSIPLPFIKNQDPKKGEEVQCCVSAAIAVCMELLEVGASQTELSMLFHYFYAAEARPEKGMTLDQGLRTAETWGICLKTLHPFPIDFHSVSVEPNSEAKRNGEDRILDRYEILSSPRNVTAWKSYLDKGLPLILIFYFHRSLYLQIPSNEFIHPPLSGSPSKKAHAVTLVGYDDLQSLFTVQDCRGEDWGISGKWFLPYRLAESQNFTHSVGIIERSSKGE